MVNDKLKFKLIKCCFIYYIFTPSEALSTFSSFIFYSLKINNTIYIYPLNIYIVRIVTISGGNDFKSSLF